MKKLNSYQFVFNLKAFSKNILGQSKPILETGRIVSGSLVLSGVDLLRKQAGSDIVNASALIDLKCQVVADQSKIQKSLYSVDNEVDSGVSIGSILKGLLRPLD